MLGMITVQALPTWQKMIVNEWVLVVKSKTPTTKQMKRIGFLYEKIASMQNLQLADKKAQKGKALQYGVMVHRKNARANLDQLREQLSSLVYKTSPYSIFKVYEPKERTVYRLPYFPDRIVHHAIMNILEPIFVSHFTADTYSCIKGRGIHAAAEKLKAVLKKGTDCRYCLKMDITQFYPSVDHEILKDQLRRKFKDANLLTLLDEIIDSAEGLPIGNYLSQYLANFYLTGLDRYIKGELRIKHYYRYADDLVLLSDDKESLHFARVQIQQYLQKNLKLTLKGNYQVFPVSARGIDFLGYKFFPTHTLLRKSIKQTFARKLAKGCSHASVASYLGWAKHANARKLVTKLLYDKFQRTGYKARTQIIHRRQNQN